MTRTGTIIRLPPLREHEVPDGRAAALSLPPERDTFAIQGERMTAKEEREMARPVAMAPLIPSEEPDSSARAGTETAGPQYDEPDWGAAKRAPDIIVQGARLLRPWDD